MSINLELKAYYSSIRAAQAIARKIKARRASVLQQTDTYFNVPFRRLKLREIHGKHSELIFYERSNQRGSRFSDYRIVPLRNPSDIKCCLRLFTKKVVVRKRRLLYFFHKARIHLDSVRGLETFVEFEIPVLKGKRQARKLMAFLKKQFGISDSLVQGLSYSDLLLNKRKGLRKS